MLAAALIAAALCLGIFGPALWRVTPPDERRLAAACVLATLPVSWLMFHGVRLPLDGWLKSLLAESETLHWIRTTYAPLTEEPAKLWPLLLPGVRRAVTRESAGRFALAIGLGFAVGEIFMVADLVATRQPKIAALPWYQLGGFITERFLTCTIHAGTTGLVLAIWRRGENFAAGLLLAMLAHYLANFPITMAQRGWLGPKALSQTLVLVWIAGCFVAGLVWLTWLIRGKASFGRLVYGQAICPECGGPYDRSIIGLNFGFTRRYERCPHCRKWHWTVAAA